MLLEAEKREGVRRSGRALLPMFGTWRFHYNRKRTCPRWPVLYFCCCALCICPVCGTTVYDRLEEASATSLPYEVRHNSWWVQEVAGSPASAGPTTFYTSLFIRGPKRVPPLTNVVSYFYVRSTFWFWLTSTSM